MELPREIQARRGFSLSYKGKVLLSKIDPIAQAERIVQSLDLKERTLYLCPSPLYAYGLQDLLERMHSSSAILCIEADSNLFEIASKYINNILDSKKNSALQQRLLLAKLKPPTDSASTEAVAEICTLVNKTWGERSFQRIELIRLNGGWQLFSEFYEKINDLLQKNISQSWTNAITMIHMGRLFIKNAIRNMLLLAKCPSVLSNIWFNDEPILVLGAGPSADIILDELSLYKKAGKRPFKIICVDSCIPSLKERGIEPDLAVILESQHYNLRVFINTKAWKINAVVDLSSLPISACLLGGETYLSFTPWTELNLFKRLKKKGFLPQPLNPLGSVGLTAVELALRLGSGKIILAGLDFSYSLDSSHSRASPVHLSSLFTTNRFKSMLNTESAFRERTFVIKSKSGLLVRTDPGMMNYRNLFEEEFSRNPRIFDISGSGLSLGLKTLSCAEAIAILGTSKTSEALSMPDTQVKISSLDVADFIRNEIDILNEMKNMLQGLIPADQVRLDELLCMADYLWLHFPEFAGTSDQRPSAKDLSFLKRVRMELDPFLKLWNMALGEISGNLKKN